MAFIIAWQVRCAPNAPAWLPLAIDHMEASGAFVVDGASGVVARATQLPAAVWLAATMGSSGSVHSVIVRQVGLAQVASKLSGLRLLQRLDLSHNALTSLPDALGQLSALRLVDLSHNRLPSVPACVWAWRGLEVLNLSHNRLAALPEARMAAESTLRELDVSHNHLRHLP